MDLCITHVLTQGLIFLRYTEYYSYYRQEL